MANTKKENHDDVKQIRKVTLWSKNEIRYVGGHLNANKILTEARDNAVKAYIESIEVKTTTL